MRRKIFQHFSNVCCQMFLTSLRNYDRINFVLFGSGILEIDFLTQRCSHNRIAVSPLFYCIEYRQWLEKQCEKEGIEFAGIVAATMRVEMAVTTQRDEHGGIRGWLSASMDFECSSLIATDEKQYFGKARDSMIMGLGQILHGQVY